MRKGRDERETGKNRGEGVKQEKRNKEKKIITFLVAANVIDSLPPERRTTGTPTDWNADRSCQYDFAHPHHQDRNSTTAVESLQGGVS